MLLCDLGIQATGRVMMGIRELIRKVLGKGQVASPKPRLRPHRSETREQLEARIIASHEHLRSIKGMYAGRRGFVIGNGPSLRIEDLDRLQGEVCIASNKIYLAFERTPWRPTFFTVVDDLIWKQIAGELHRYVPRVFIPSYLEPQPTAALEVITMRSLDNAADTKEDAGMIPFSPDVDQGVHGGYTVTYENLQLAVHVGLNPIYLLGCDHFYTGVVGVEAGGPVRADDVHNHFVKGYSAPGDAMNPALVSRMTKSYQWAQRYAEHKGRSFINATRGGHLEVFPREDLDVVLGRDGSGPLPS